MAKTGAIEKLKAMAKDRVDAKALKDFVAAGKDVPLSYKGREHVWAKKVKKYAAGGSANSKGKASNLSVLEMGDMSSPAYRAHLERKQGLEGSYPEALVAPAVRGAASAAKGFLGNLGKTKPGQFPPGHYEFANARRDAAMSQLTKQEMDTFYRTGNLPSRFPELLENASAIGSKVGRIPMPKPEKKTLQEHLVEGVMTPAGRRSAVDLGLNTANQMSDNFGVIDVPSFQAGGLAKLAKSLTGAKKAEGAAKPSAGPAFGAYGYTDDLLRRERGSFASVFGVDYGQTLAPSFEFAPVNRLNTTEKVDEAKVRSLMQAMKESGNTLDNRIPPVVVDSAGNVLDGHHRVEAARRLGYDQVPIIEKFDRQSGPKFGDEYAEGGAVHMQDGGKADKPYIGYRRAGRRPESQQDRAASANIPVAVARGLVSGTLGMPGDLESLARLPYELITGKESPTILPTSGDIEKRLPFRGASQTPVGQMFTGASQLAGGAYTGPLSGARAVMAVPRAIKRAGQDFVQAAGQPAVNVIKPKGGNWLTGNVEKQVGRMKMADEMTPEYYADRQRLLEEARAKGDDRTARIISEDLEVSRRNDAINNWIDRNLTNYIKKEMATPEDPVRKLAEEGILHIKPFGDQGVVSSRLQNKRLGAGFSPVGEGKSEAAKFWERQADISIDPYPAGSYKHGTLDEGLLEANPWLKNVPDEQMINYAKGINDLGFDHIVDVLRQDVRAGRIRPEQLSKVSMEQAVRRTYDFDQDMAKKMREAQIKATEGMPVHKEYPEGYRWVELGPGKELPEGWTTKNGAYYDPKGERHVHPDSEKVANALKYEGDTMGHCVGGYCPDVLEGRSRIYSLRDAKGEPHVTVEVQPMDHYERQAAQMKRAGASSEEIAAFFENPPQKIVQIKGKQNRAPNEEYLPFVQDFVRGGKWSDVGDIQNTGLRRYDAPEGTKYVTEAEYSDELLKELGLNPGEGMKAGGEVKMAGAGAVKDALKKLLKKEKVDHPLVFPRAEPKTKEEIRPIAQRVAEQMTGEFVRQNPKVTTNPAGKSRKQFQRERNIPLETRNVVPEMQVSPVDYEKLKDYAIVGVPGDPSMGGVARAGSFDDPARATVELTRVGDITPDSPVPLFGGPRYGDYERFWASNFGAATPIQSNVNALGELYDAPVLGKYIKMAPDSANFAMHNLDSLLSIQRPEQLSKGKMEQLNRLIRNGSPKYGKFPGFSGFDDPVDVLLQSQLNSDLRKHIAETLTKPTITQALGLPNGQDVVAAITHPELRNLETGVSGFSIGRMVPGATLKKGESAHPTYDTDIPGQLIGRSKYPTPYEIAFPDTTAYARSQLKPGVQEFNMMKLLGPRERIDQQYVDEMKTFEELMKQYTGKKKGGAVKSGLSSIKKV